MNALIVNCIRAKRIDSFQKLRFLLYLHRHPEMKGTCQEFAKQLYLGDTAMLAEIIADLQNAGLVDCVEDRYMLGDKPVVRAFLQRLAQIFEDPLARQELLDRVTRPSPSFDC